MALTNYNELKNAVIAASFRDDLDLQIPLFVATAENDMFNNVDEPLYIPEMDVFLSQSVSTKTFALPTGFRKFESITLSNGSDECPIEFRNSANLNRRGSTGRPTQYTISGTNVEFNVAPDVAYDISMNYVKTPDALTAANPTNVVLTKNPNLYLFGTLAALFFRSQDTENADAYYLQFISAIRGTNNAAQEASYTVAITSNLGSDQWTP